MERIKVGVVHTFLYSVEDIKAQFKEFLPEVEMVNIIDDSLLAEVLANKGLTPGIISRMCAYYNHLERLGCAVALNQCSSVGEAADVAAKTVSMPIVKIDAPMARKSVELGSNIAVIATAISTVEPSARLVEQMALEAGKKVTVNRCYVEGAYDLLLKTGDKAAHNQMVIDKVREASATNDVIVLAQGSMYHLLPLIKDVSKPVLTSLETGVRQIRDVLGLS